jgi:hypothetical protein
LSSERSDYQPQHAVVQHQQQHIEEQQLHASVLVQWPFEHNQSELILELTVKRKKSGANWTR